MRAAHRSRLLSSARLTCLGAGPKSRRVHRLQLLIAFFCVYILYGANYLGIRVSVRGHIPAVTSGGVRYLFAGAVVLLALAIRGRRIRLDRAGLCSTILCGLLVVSVSALLVVAEKHVSSGLAALLVASAPLIVVALRVGVDREPLSVAIIASVLVGFAGVALVVIFHGGSASGSLVGVLLCLMTAAGIALGTFLIPRLPLPAGTTASAGWQMAWGGLVLLIIGAVLGEWSRFRISDVPFSAWLGYGYLSTLGTFAAFLGFIWLLGEVPVSQVAAGGYVNPIVAVLLGWALAGEALGARSLLGGALIVASVAFIIARDRGRLATSPRIGSAEVRGAEEPPDNVGVNPRALG